MLNIINKKYLSSSCLLYGVPAFVGNAVVGVYVATGA